MPRIALAALSAASCAPPPTSPEPAPSCSATYPGQATSPYVLPYQIGRAFTIGQGNCGRGSHARGSVVQFAYDVLMPIGTPIVAARRGAVLLVEERFNDGTRRGGEENYINVVHHDGTVAGYVHLTINGALVNVGDAVERGDIIALSGDSGSSTEPHLHFHVQACIGCPTVPIVFFNTRPHPIGLLVRETYRAEPFGS